MKLCLRSRPMLVLASVLAIVFACPRAYGTGLQSDSVYFGSTHIGAIAVADFNKDSHLDIVTVDGDTGTDNFILMGQADGTFISKFSFTASGHLSAVVAGDFNADGTPDIAVTDSNANNVIVLLGAGDGTFTTKATIATGASPVAIAAADLNRDGKLDLVVANNPAGTITTYLGAGDGTFVAQTPQNAGETDPVALTTGDFNADGKIDVAVALNSNAFSILGGNGNGTLQAPATTTIYDVNPTDIKAVDFNGNGMLDLIVCTGDSVLFFPGNGSLSFAGPDHLAALPGFRIAIADMNGDGHPDIVVTSRAWPATVLTNNESGGIASVQTWHGVSVAAGIAAGDFNGDGKPDVAVASLFGSIHVMSGNGDGTLRGALYYDSQTGGCEGPPEGIVTADFNRDGRPDVAVSDACRRVTVLLNNGDFKFTTVLPPTSTGLTQSTMIAADMNGDGIPDIVSISVGNNSQIAVLLGNGDGTFKPGVATDISSSGFHHIVAGDFNGDGKLDVAYTETNPPDSTDTTVGVLFGNGDGSFEPLSTVLTAGELPDGLAAGDFNGDGNLDLAVLNGGDGLSSSVSIFLGTGSGTFNNTGLSIATGAFPIDIAAVDFNKDGKLDLVVANSGNGGVGTVQAFAGNGDGTFVATFTSSTPTITTSIESMAVGDFDGDGFPDIAVWANDAVHIFLRSGAVNFSDPATLGLGDSYALLAAADFNGGGAADLAGADGALAILPNTGGLKVALTSSSNPSAFAESISFSATLVPSFPGHLGPLTGSVQFQDGATVLGTYTPDSSGTATFTTATLNPGSHAVGASYPGDSNYIARTIPVITQVVNRAGTSVGLTASAPSAVLGKTIVFSTSTTAATSGVPTGTVSLHDGSTTIATLPVDGSGAASFNVSSLTAGSHSITASYSGDLNYLDSSSSAASETIFATPDFQIGTSNPSAAVSAGQSAKIPLNFVAADFPGPVTFSCSGLPSLASCSFSPSSLPLGTGNFSAMLTITTTAATIAALQPAQPGGNPGIYSGCLVLGFVGLLICLESKRKWPAARAIQFAVLTLGLAFVCGCGGGGSGSGGGGGPKTIPGTPAGTYSVVVQASGPAGATISHQITVMLTVSE